MFNEEFRLAAPIRWAMVGGGRGSEIGYAHRSAAARDHLFTLTAGAFDIDPARGKDFGKNLGLAVDRCYPDYQTLFAEEAKRPDGIQAVSVATPNSTHYEIVKAALNADLHVICEKPITFTISQAEDLKKIADEKQKLLGVMYGYSGFPMIHQARTMVDNDDLGEIRIINMQFAHGFHNTAVEEKSPGAKWRMNPEISGPSYVLSDIGTHAFFLGEFISGLEVIALLCTRQSFIASRAPLEDNANVLLKYNNNAIGSLWASAVNAGSMHQQKIRVVGEKASIEWWDEYPNQLRYEIQGQPAQILERGMGYLDQTNIAMTANRIGGGHAEGFFESWANLYHRFAVAIDALNNDDLNSYSQLWYPDVGAGLNGVTFVNRCVESADAGSIWVQFR